MKIKKGKGKLQKLQTFPSSLMNLTPVQFEERIIENENNIHTLVFENKDYIKKVIDMKELKRNKEKDFKHKLTQKLTKLKEMLFDLISITFYRPNFKDPELGDGYIITIEKGNFVRVECHLDHKEKKNMEALLQNYFIK